MGDLGSIPGLGRSPGEGKGYSLQYSGLENSTDCIVHGEFLIHESGSPNILLHTLSPQLLFYYLWSLAQRVSVHLDFSLFFCLHPHRDIILVWARRRYFNVSAFYFVLYGYVCRNALLFYLKYLIWFCIWKNVAGLGPWFLGGSLKTFGISQVFGVSLLFLMGPSGPVPLVYDNQLTYIKVTKTQWRKNEFLFTHNPDSSIGNILLYHSLTLSLSVIYLLNPLQIWHFLPPNNWCAFTKSQDPLQHNHWTVISTRKFHIVPTLLS